MVDLNEKIERWIREYERATRTLGEDPDFDDVEAMQALVCRDSLADNWSGLSDNQRHTIEEIDELLVTKYGIVGTELPIGLDNDRSRWWWFLGEGPQGREEAEKLKQEAVA